jgi:predicted pyridoxine 5'-phosphate oxidase superfamily flavin-nucleotide-binding protein
VLGDDMKRVVREQRLGYVASVCPDGTPNLSPKGTTEVWDDDHLVFLDMHSPGTVANIEAGNAVVEVNVVDPLRRKGYRFKGPAEVHRDGPVFEDVVQRYERERAIDRARINSVVLVRIVQAAPLVSPAYDDGTSEEAIVQQSLDVYGLVRKTTGDH